MRASCSALYCLKIAGCYYRARWPSPNQEVGGRVGSGCDQHCEASQFSRSESDSLFVPLVLTPFLWRIANAILEAMVAYSRCSSWMATQAQRVPVVREESEDNSINSISPALHGALPCLAGSDLLLLGPSLA